MALSPMMQRYVELKERYKDCLVFYRLGDFYEMFFDDAKIASKELQLALTGRDCGLTERAPMCGVPHHSVNIYINKLLEKNYKVAIVEQLTDPKATKGLVERDVVRVVTPGTIIEDDMLENKTNNFLLSVALEKNKVALAWADVSTGEFNVTGVPFEPGLSKVCDRIFEINPNEIIVNEEFFKASEGIPKHIIKQFRPFYLASDVYNTPDILKKLYSRFSNAEKLGKRLPVTAAAALWEYLAVTQKNALAHMNTLTYIEGDDYLVLDNAAVKNLEIFRSLGDHGQRGSLLWLLDKTGTPMGARKLKSWLERPLRIKEDIEKRLDAVEELYNDYALREDLVLMLSDISDVERILTRVAYGTVSPRETVFIRRALKNLPQIKRLLENTKSEILKFAYNDIDTLEDIYSLLEAAIMEAPADSIRDGGVIRDGYSEELDKYRDAIRNGQGWISQIEAREREATGIKTLRIKYNRVFGYFIEVTNSFKDKVPYTYIRRQTLAGSERYTTPELKETEELVSGSEEKALRLENIIFTDIREKLTEALFRIKRTANAVAVTDAIVSLSLVSSENNYVRPRINTNGVLKIKAGRHPVVEVMQASTQFVPNDTLLDLNENRFNIITGPNMAGKSTYMRQTAIITLMAHLGCFVPCEEADISVCDRLFTRVGASDDLSAGQSTFMLEMTEVASILKNATKHSLIILDEIGRGTSTFDGLSIAWAVTEYIAEQKNIGAKTLFATHYHELSELEGALDGVKNYSITAREYGDDVIFLRKIVRGSADKSFGIQVASLAGVPKPVLTRAKAILKDLEKADITRQASDPLATQTTLFASTNMEKIVEELKQVDINTLTPIEAINILCELREKAKREI
jgi:DNA mismatch repair protein MutS